MFGEKLANSHGIQSAEVKHTSHRIWSRLVGRRHDIQLWDQDERKPRTNFKRPLKTLIGAERWVQDAVALVHGTSGQKTMPKNVSFTVELSNVTSSGIARVSALIKTGSAQRRTRPEADGEEEEEEEQDSSVMRTVKELVCFREPLSVHVYDILEHGRRMYRSLVYASHSSCSLHETPDVKSGMAELLRPLPPRLTLVIKRNLTRELGIQTFIPRRFLAGILPDSLLQRYIFWQNEHDDTIIGYVARHVRAGGNVGTLSQLHIQIVKNGIPDLTGHCMSAANGLITRIPTRIKKKDTSSVSKSKFASRNSFATVIDQENTDLGIGANEEPDPKGVSMKLLSLMYTKPGTHLKNLANLFMRIENLGHILVWSYAEDKKDAKGKKSRAGIDLANIELPRLRLHFEAKEGESDMRSSVATKTLEIHSVDHPGLYISNAATTCALTRRLLKGLPHSLLLERSDKSLFIMLPATSKPSHVLAKSAAGFAATELKLVRGDKEWISNIGEVRHYLYPVHPSRLFMFTETLASALYLLMLRFLNRQYEQVFQLADFCVKDTELSPEEDQIFRQLHTLESDLHPDAAACRLKLCVVTSGTIMGKSCPFSVDEEMQTYVSKLPQVSGNCRFTVDEEIALLELVCSAATYTEEEDYRICKSDGESDEEAYEELATPRRGDESSDDEEFMTEKKRAARAKAAKERASRAKKRKEQKKKKRKTKRRDRGRGAKENRSGKGVSAAVRNRYTFLLAFQKAKQEKSPVAISLQPVQPTLPSVEETTFDKTKDRSSIQADDNFLKKMGVLNYARPREEELLGVEGAKHLRYWLRKGMRLTTGGQSLGFLFLYELMTCKVQFRLLSADNTYNWGSILLRMLPTKDTVRSKSVFNSILRILAFNGNLCDDAPEYKDTRRFKLATVFRGQNIIQRLIKACREYFTKAEKKGELLWPEIHPDYVQPTSIVLGTVAELENTDRLLTAPRASNSGLSKQYLRPVPPVTAHGSKVEVTMRDIASFSSLPLASIGLKKFMIARSRQQRGDPLIPPEVPFKVEKHPITGKSSVCRSLLARLVNDKQFYANDQNKGRTPELTGFSLKDVRRYTSSMAERACSIIHSLSQALVDLRIKDLNEVSKLVRMVLSLVNHINPRPPQAKPGQSVPESATADYRRRLAFLMSRHHGQEAKVGFELLITSLMSTEGDADLKRVNPFLSKMHLTTIKHLTVSLMLTVNRLGQTARSIIAARVLAGALKKKQAALEGGKAMPEEQNDFLSRKIALSAQALTAQLTAKRFFLTRLQSSPGAPGGVEFDPRLLIFEFIHNVLLRKAQVQLIRQFQAAIKSGASRCHQMIMGAGKTTVIGPMLVMLLEDEKGLITQVCPGPLLDFSRDVMRSRFSAVITKPVYTFTFDRFMQPSYEILRNLLKAKATGGVVMSSPTSIKAFALKFVECIATLEQEERGAANDKAFDDRGFLQRAKDTMASLFRKDEKSEREVLMGEMKFQAKVCHQVLTLFQQGTAILDEVDLLLHPLKSELNWPLGPKKPLDFSTSKKGNGLRWKIPFHLLDAMFYTQTGKMTVDFKQSREAFVILNKLTAVVKAGCDQKLLQRSPHLAIVDKKYYARHMKPLLARWLLVWLSSKQITGVKHNDLLEYLLRGRYSPNAKKIETVLHDDYVKMLNLGHDWLASFFPHACSKINRVMYGLLRGLDMERALERTPWMPPSRRFLAIPFVGKDVPTIASEFAHPDVQIGVSILSYRYEGLRESDFKHVIQELQARMETESGKYPNRKANRLWVKWVNAAGGRVRGTKRQETKTGDSPMQSPKTSSAAVAEMALSSVANEVGFSAQVESESSTQIVIGEKSIADILQDLWPLQLVDLRDAEQMDILYTLLNKEPLIVEHYLNEFIFPQVTLHLQPEP